MANVWHALRVRGNVRSYLVVPEPLAQVLFDRGLADRDDPFLWALPDSFIGRFVRLDVVSRRNNVLAHLRSRVVARHFAGAWHRITSDPNAVIHVGLDTSPLNPPDVPIVYECMDSTLQRLGGRHYAKAAARRSVINCQTERIREALESRQAHRRPFWTTVTSPNYFATYPPISATRRDPMLVAFVGRLIPGKNPLTFVEAIGRLRAGGLPVRAIMLGFGTQIELVRARLMELGLNGVVEIDHAPHPGERLQEAAIYVSLQAGDNYGSQSLLEAMGAGCAVVASDVGDTRRLITPEVGRLTGFQVEEVTTALADMLRHPEETARMGAAGSQLVRSQYTADSYAAFLESLYELAVEKHSA